ncbi:ABC transporter B member 10 [Aphanomyces cochlioides]|nr:ABC transporter B member 10 [Aphanomyces cochlioides]
MSKQREDDYDGIQTPQAEAPQGASTSVPLPPGENASDDEFSFASMYRYADGKDKILMGVGLLCAAVNGSALPFMAVVFGNSVNAFVAPIDFDKVHIVTLEFLLMAIGLFVTGYGFFACFAITAERQMKKLRCEFFKHIMHQEMGWYDQRNASELASRLAGDTIKMKEGMGTKLGEALRFVCQFIAGYAIGFSYGWNLSLVMCCVMPLLALSLTLLMKRLRDSAVRSQQVYAAAGAVAEETIGAMRTVASLNGEERALAKYAESIAKVEEETIGVSKFVAFAQSWFTTSIWLTYVIGLWYGSWLVSKQSHAVSDPGTVFSAFYGILMGTTSLAQVTPSLNAVASAKGAATAIFNILARKSEIDTSDLSDEVPATCEGNIEARDVHFAYPSRPEDPILRGYSLTIKKSETVAFVGASGSGRSTLVALLERFYQPTSGAIYLDGRDISTLQLKWLRSQIGLVSQEPVLFATTIFQNIAAGGENISRDQVIAAAKLANAHDFIMGLPDGYDTMCGEKGATLSGGQKQRVAIARALVRQPKILILDEATSALDNESERVVQEALNNLMAHTDMTTIVIAHRLSTIRTADKIAVISKGVVVELGRHDDLMRLENGFYRSLVQMQLSSHELDNDGSHAVEITAKSESMDGGNKADTATLEPKLVDAVDDNVDEVTEHTKAKVGRIFDLTMPQRMYLIAGTIACSLQGFAMPSIAMVISKVIHDMNKHYADFLASGKKDMEPLTALYDDISHSAFIFLGVAAAIFVAAFVSTYSFRIIAEKLTSRLRKMHFQALLRQEIGFFDLPGNTTGVLTTDLSSHATKVVAIAGDNQAKMLQALFTIVSALVIAFIWGSWKLTLVTTAACPLLLVGSYARAKQLKGGNFSDNLADSGSLAAEAIANARTVTAFGLQQEIAARYEASLEKPLKEGVKEAHVNGFMEGIASFSMFAVYALVFWYGARLLDDGSISFKQLMNTLMVIMMAAQSVGQSASIFGDRDIAKKSAAKIFSIVDRKPLIASATDEGVKPNVIQGRIEFKDVFFNYPSRPDVKVLRHYDLTIEPGQTVAFCGPSGGGKSTCVALLERFYNPTSGSITLDGRDISTLNLHWLRSQIGLVGQEPVLFVGSIAENIASGISDSVPSTDLQERVEEAAKMANAHNFIMQFPDGYQTQVGLKGEQLSGGQKQRIAIARAIMKNPSILLLDEATSALDSESEKVVQEALDKLLAAKGRTTIVIAHRLSTIRNADKICVVSGGRIAEQGTHDELLKHNGIYTRLVHMSSHRESTST